MDLRDFADGGDFTSEGFTRLAAGDLSVPVIGAVNGTAIGGGLELLLGCDIIVASSAAEFGLPEIKRGLFPAGGGTALGTRIPLGIALEMTLTGDYFTAERAYEIGLINAVAAPADVLDTAIGCAERVAANAPLGLATCKELVRLSITDAAAWFTWYGFGRRHGQFAIAHIHTALTSEEMTQRLKRAEGKYEMDAQRWLPLGGADHRQLAEFGGSNEGWLPLTPLATQGLLNISRCIKEQPIRL